MEFEVANGSWRHGLILSVRCGDVRRQAPLSYDTRIAFPQEAVTGRQVQVDVFAKIGTDTFNIDPRMELYDLKIGGDSEGFSGLALRVRSQEEANLRRRLEDAQASDECIEQADQKPPPRHPLGAPSDSDPGDSISAAADEQRLQRARQDAAEYVERFDLRQVLQNMFQRVIRERPEDPFTFMQAFLNNGSTQTAPLASVEADAAQEEERSQREQDLQRQLDKERARVLELEAGGAVIARDLPQSGSEQVAAASPSALEEARRREEDSQHQLTLVRAQVTASARRIESLEQQLKEAKRGSGSLPQDASAAKRPVSASADSDAAEAAIHEATAARDAAVARELAAAAAAVQEAAASRDAAVTRELATLQERTDLKRRCQEHEHSAKQLEKKLQALQRKSGMTVSDKEAGAESLPPSPRKGKQPSLAEQLDTERSKHHETQEKCRDLERKLAEASAAHQLPPLASRKHLLEEEVGLDSKAVALASSREPASEELRFAEAVRQYKELEQRHQQSEEKCAEMERRCHEAERRTLELLRDSQGPIEKAALQPATSETPKREDSSEAAVREVKLLTERVEVERRCHEQAILDYRDKERQCAAAERRREELEARLEQEEAARKRQTETCEMLAQRLQDLEASHSNAPVAAAEERSAASRDLEERVESQQMRIEVLQRKIQAYENLGFVDPATQASPLGDAAAGQRGPANKVGLGGAPSTASTSTMAPPTASTGSGSLPPAGSVGAEVNTHMFSQLLASTYAPPVPPTTFVEAREDPEVEPGQPDPAVLVEVVDCKDVLSNGIFAWVGVCNLRPLYRLLGPEPRYLFYAEADIASNWRIVNRMGSEEYVERFRRPADAKVPVECEKGDAGGSVFEVKLTPEIVQRVSMVNSHDEKVTIRNKLADTYGQQFVNLESKGRGLISKASPVVAIAFALESQQRAIQLLHSQLSVENQRREAAEQHASTMQQAFETLQLRIQAQLPGPPSVAGLQEVQASLVAARHPGAASERSIEGAVRALASPGSEQEWTSDQGSDRGPSFGPMPHPPIVPKDKKPVPPPTFRRGPSGLRNSKAGPHAPAYPPDNAANKAEDPVAYVPDTASNKADENAAAYLPENAANEVEESATYLPDKVVPKVEDLILPDPPPSVEPVPATGEAPLEEN